MISNRGRQLGLFDELIVDNFAGGGGASTGIEAAIGRSVDIAINHDAEAIAMHQANHPSTRHYCEDVWDVDPVEATGGKPVGLAWFSPDCKHFSKAKGGKPRDKKIRGLAWVAIRWAATVKPRMIFLENVEEFLTWGPLLPDGMPCPDRKGQTFKAFVRKLEKLGYKVEWRELRACDYGAPTIRKRLFLIASRDGQPIVWPDKTHGAPESPEVKAGKLKPWRTAAECIDWSIPCPSIFERDKPLADATLRRIARGIQKYVIDAAEPFIVTCNHSGEGFRGQGLNEPFKTITAARDAHGLIVPTLIQTGYGERDGQAPRVPGLEKPLGTTMAQGIKHALAVATLIKHYGGNGAGAGVDLKMPVHTVTATDHHGLVTANLVRQFGTSNGADINAPAGTIMADGGGGKTQLVKAFLSKYYGCGEGQSLSAPAHTITSQDRFALVTINQIDYVIVDIGMRMLQPHELFRAQGFPDDYQIAPQFNGKPLTKTAQVRMCGNSVSPVMAEALVRANFQSASKQSARYSKQA